ncbi:hypothetical protein Mal48_33960 [Thalassoglobus polymorphus]|uniref:Uncharacterized protein n=1 Tax=Thalassoglobus polymorphus TaxID=2527994 RepID=A0A517QR76_9PLAN|nr:hypothetical protein Mal48_33960 [Thalassoglobus polymorphus]
MTYLEADALMSSLFERLNAVLDEFPMSGEQKRG